MSGIDGDGDDGGKEHDDDDSGDDDGGDKSSKLELPKKRITSISSQPCLLKTFKSNQELYFNMIREIIAGGVMHKTNENY